MSYFTSDPIADYDHYLEDAEAWMESRPICIECEQPITDEKAYHFGGHWYCIDCMEEYLESID